MGYVFISYSTKNQQMADSFRVLLNQNGIETWMAPGDILFGSTYTATINRAIKDSSCFMLLFSENAQNSQWVPKETERAVSSGKTIFTVLLDDVPMNDSFEIMLSTSQTVAIRKIDENDEKIKKLIKAIKVLAGETTDNSNKTSIAEETAKSSEQTTSAHIKETELSVGFVIIDGVLKEYTGNAEKVAIPQGVTGIGNSAFKNCESLTSITIPDSVTSIGEYAFCDCTSLTKITIPDSVTNIGSHAFSGCENLCSVTIANGVRSIDDNAFEYCENLVSVTIPNSVADIGNKVFSGCERLEMIDVLRDNNEYSSLNGILYNKDGTEIIKYPAGKKAKSYEIPNGVTIIGSYAFEGSANLTVVTMPDTVVMIEEGAFWECENIVSAKLPNSVTHIGDDAFGGCENLASITITKSVVSIGFGAFSSCHALEEIEVSNDNKRYTSVNGVLFNKNKTVLMCCPAGKEETSYIIPSGVTEIVDDAFWSCENLVTVTIPESVTTIGAFAFGACTNLVTITIPKSATNIEDNAFEFCYKIASVSISREQFEQFKNAFPLDVQKAISKKFNK